MPELGSHDRDLLAGDGARLFQRAVAEDGLPADGLAEADRAAAALLIRLGLLVRTGGHLLPLDPTTAQAQVVNPLSRRGSELLAESAEWARVFGEMAHTWRQSPRTEQDAFSEVRLEAIDPFLDALLGDAQEEVLTAQPQTGRIARALASASRRDIDALDRGVRMRTLYQHSARRQPATRDYVAEVTARGGEVRTVDEFFNRLIVVDRKVALIPGHEGLFVAMAIREPSTVAYLVDMFERSWERGRPFTSSENSTLRNIQADQRATTVRMLVEGHADGVSAKRLGVSPRTYAGYIADLKVEYDVSTRFQLGYAMGREQAGDSREPRPLD